MSETIPASVMNAAGVLALLNGGLNSLTRLPTVDAQKPPPLRNAIWPVFDAVPFLNVADGVLEPESGAVKYCRFPALSPTARFPFASTATATTLFETMPKFDVVLVVSGRLNCSTVPDALSLPT